MNSFLLAIRAFLTQDVKSENETKYLAILLRILSILSAVYMLFVSVYLVLINYYAVGIFTTILLAAYFAIFIQTYTTRTKVALIVFYVVSIITSILCLFTGFDKNFQWSIIVVGMVSFYSIETEIKLKLKNFTVLMVIFICITALTSILGPYKTAPKLTTLCYNVVTALYYGQIFLAIGYSYYKKFNASEEKLYNYNQKLYQMASIDTLTQLANRRSMTDYMVNLSYDKNKRGDIFCIAIADLDFFKKINDVYGHYAGDFILQEVSKIFTETMNGRGKVARWGGEEFLFCFDDLNLKQSYNILNEMRDRIDKQTFVYDNNEIHVTLTIGLEEYYHVSGVEGTISKADKKLYDGKKAGRNRVVI